MEWFHVVSVSSAFYVLIGFSFEVCHCQNLDAHRVAYEYPEEVPFRIIVLTYSRPKSLARCLDHVNGLITDGTTVRVEIWIDRHVNGSVDDQTVAIVNRFPWCRHVLARVHVHPEHVGLYGQWIRTWRPKPGSREIVLYLEDDVDVSPYAYRWLTSAYAKYRGVPDLAAISLQEEYMITASGRRRGVSLYTPEYDPVYFYRIVGPWGLSPHPDHWRRFQDWFHGQSAEGYLDPNVPQAGLYYSWYRDMKRENRTNSMWIIWYISYCELYSLYTGFANLKAYTKDPKTLLVVNRREDGLHFTGRRRPDADQFLLDHWNLTFIKFPDKITRIDYDGTFF